MVNLLILVAIAAVFLDVRRVLRRRRYDPTVLIRDIGIALAGLYLVIEGSRFWINYAWWRELGYLPTYWQLIRIRWAPQLLATILGIFVLVVAFRLGRRRSTGAVASTRLFGWLGHLVAFGVGLFLAISLIDPWTVALWLGSRLPGQYHDPVFGRSLAFYLFRLPFYQMLFAWLGFLAVLALLLYGGTLVLGASAERMNEFRERFEAQARGYPIPMRRQPQASLPSFNGLARAGAVLLLLLYVVHCWFARYDLLYNQHSFLYGADYVDVRLGLPLIWFQLAAAALLALALLLARRAPEGEPSVLGLRPRWLAPLAGAAFLLILLLPPVMTAVVRSIYVNPNQLTLERPYIINHIAATRMAYGIQQNSREQAFVPAPLASLDLANWPDTADNIRLWDSTPFLENLTQLQALRPYYDFPTIGMDRYRIGNEKRQVMIAARNLNTTLLPSEAQTWVNLHLQYTHGYGAVVGLVNQASQEGEPRLVLQNAPPESSLPRFQLTRPETYFGEQTSNWVFVDTSQQEFNYPKGDENAYSTYHGRAGIPLAGFGIRLAAAITENDTNILLTKYLTPQSRLLLHRQIVKRVKRLAPFLHLDPDPYLVVDPRDRLFWMLDAYTLSGLHPYSQPMDYNGAPINYIRNSVKITVDAYNGSVRFYVFDPRDPILAAYRNVFPHLFLPRSAMPAGLLRHVRYPETLFQAQAEIYRIYHMTDPQVFYNKEDLWDIARQVVSQGETSETNPYYIMMQLPGESHAEFVLMLPFTSHTRDNLIAWIAARCDPRHYGQILFFRLPKEQLVYGPLQIESRIDQNRNISKDLSLWNQQGSRVIRGTTLVLPVDHTFIYIEPIYIQATQAHLPELKKVVLAVGNRLIYSDTLPQAMALMAQPPGGTAFASTAAAETTLAPGAAAITGAIPAAVLEQIAADFRQYRSLTAAGKLDQAGARLQAISQTIAQALTRYGRAVPVHAPAHKPPQPRRPAKPVPVPKLKLKMPHPHA